MFAVRATPEPVLQAVQGRQAPTSTQMTSARARLEREVAPLKLTGGSHVSQNVARCGERLPEPHRSEFLALHQEADRLVAVGWSLRKSAWALYRREMEWL